MKEQIKNLLREAINKIGPLNDNFIKWFNGSKIVNPDGSPLICYHGTNTDIKKFDNYLSNQGVFWFSSNKTSIESGESGANSISKIIPVFLSAKKIAGWDLYDKLSLGEIENLGYDAIKLGDDYVIFEPNQIKSIYNNGNWNPNNKNIYG
jgi:hypothetical protein